MPFVPLPESFFEPSAQVVAPLLLGHWLLRQNERGWAGGPIVETEAYLVDDPASHGYSGETARNRAMYGPPGRAYVYLIYGYHYCVNAVCHPTGYAEAVLIRAIEPEYCAAWMNTNREAATPLSLTNGPAKLCAALAINRSLDGANLCDAASPLIVAANPDAAKWRASHGPMVTTTRIGLSKAADLHLRFYLDGSDYVSRRVKPVVDASSQRSASKARVSRAR